MPLRKRKTITQKGLTFSVKIKKTNGEVVSRRSPIKRKVFNFLQAGRMEYVWIYLLVAYKKGVYNDGKYYQKYDAELIKAWQAFTEENLINDALTY